jgi:uncharacterized OsmC-like protein
MTTATTPVDNGVDIDFLRGARDLLAEQPEVAQFTWRVTNSWVKGTHSRTTALSYFGLGEEHDHRVEFAFDGDHPETFMSEDNGATPTEMVLVALAGCLTAGVASVASQRDIQLHSVTASVEADMDVRGVMGVDRDIRNGFSAVRVTYSIDADATPDEIRAVVAQSQKRSAVFDIVTNPTNVAVEVS